MGAYEQALDSRYLGDFEGDDCDVDLKDFSVLAGSWMDADAAIDIDANGIIDVSELAILAANWLVGTD
jgi:hypothetical protein